MTTTSRDLERLINKLIDMEVIDTSEGKNLVAVTKVFTESVNTNWISRNLPNNQYSKESGGRGVNMAGFWVWFRDGR